MTMFMKFSIDSSIFPTALVLLNFIAEFNQYVQGSRQGEGTDQEGASSPLFAPNFLKSAIK